MKKMDKQNMKNPTRLELAFLERDISAFADCPFVASMFCSFPTKLHLCMVMEYVPGGDCGSLIKHSGALPVPLARLYIAETVLAVEYLHSYGVVHRDLKPQNLLITSTGHIKVTDFGLSKLGIMRPTSQIYTATTKDITHEFLDEETFGTAKYMAPEVILRKGYGRPVDWWSVGIILYEFLFAITPFHRAFERDILRSVLKDNILWAHHKYSMPLDARQMITELLNKNPAHRLGTDGANQIKDHPFLCVLDFNNLLSQEPLIVPNLKSDEDTSYFIIPSSSHKHMNSDEVDTSDDNDWPEIKNFVSPYQRFLKQHITNTGMMTNIQPLSPSQCSQDKSKKHSDLSKESSPSKTDGKNEEPMSPQVCSLENSEKHADMSKESSPSKTDGKNEEPMSPPVCSSENSEKHADMSKESSPSKTDGKNEEPMSPTVCSSENSEKHADMSKESSPSQTDGKNEEPMSPPVCSSENSEKHADMSKESSPSKTDGTNEEPMSPTVCSSENSEKHADMSRESSPSQTDGKNEEPMSPPVCSSENSEKHADMSKESSPSKTDGSNEEPMSPPVCSSENREKHSDMQKESSSSKTNGDNQCLTVKTSESSSPSLPESPVQKKRKLFLKLRKRQKTEKVEEGESRRGSIFRRMISSCRRGLSRAARAVRESCIFAPCHRGTINISGTENPHI